MPLVMLAFWAAVIWLAVNAMRHAPTNPEGTLAERYARGEMDENEYRHRLEVLREAAHVGNQG